MENSVAPYRIDVHHHSFLPGSAARLIERKVPLPGGWTPQHSIDDMDEAAVATAITSITAAGLRGIEPEFAACVARECNEHAPKKEADFPGRFDFFAILPLPDVDASVAEIGQALDVLHGDPTGPSKGL